MVEVVEERKLQEDQRQKKKVKETARETVKAKTKIKQQKNYKQELLKL